MTVKEKKTKETPVANGEAVEEVELYDSDDSDEEQVELQTIIHLISTHVLIKHAQGHFCPE